MLEGKKISELDQINTLSLGSSFPVLDKGATKRIAFSALLNKIENELPESDIDKVKDDVEKLKVKTESINTLTTEMEAVKDQVSGVDEMVQGQNATIRNCVSAVEGLEQVIEQTFDDVLALEEQVHANTSGIAQNAANIELKQNLLNENQLKAINSGITAELVAKIGQGGGGVPAGTVLSFAGDTEPEGFLFTEGQEVLRNAYPNLFAAIGTKYGEGDGETTFNLPDYRELVFVGAGQNAKLDIKAHDVYELGQFKDDQLQGHAHLVPNIQATATGGYDYPAGGGKNPNTRTTTSILTDGVNGTPRTGSTTHGKQIGIKYIIKY